MEVIVLSDVISEVTYCHLGRVLCIRSKSLSSQQSRGGDHYTRAWRPEAGAVGSPFKGCLPQSARPTLSLNLSVHKTSPYSWAASSLPRLPNIISKIFLPFEKTSKESVPFQMILYFLSRIPLTIILWAREWLLLLIDSGDILLLEDSGDKVRTEAEVPIFVFRVLRSPEHMAVLPMCPALGYLRRITWFNWCKNSQKGGNDCFRAAKIGVPPCYRLDWICFF